MPNTLNYRSPDGVVPMGYMASAVMGDVKREQSKFHPERVAVVLDPRETEKRARLFAQARVGNAVAIRALASEYRLRLVPVGAGRN